MGLDVTAYSDLEWITPPHWAVLNSGEIEITTKLYEWIEDQPMSITFLWDNEYFPGRILPQRQGLWTYREQYDFSAGNYGYYSRWREWLTDTLTMREIDPIGFDPMIKFADNEGTIGTYGVQVVHEAFQTHAVTLMEAADGIDEVWWQRAIKRSLGDWSRAMKLAAEDGAVSFH